MFAKLYETSKGQVVVMLQSNDDGEPEIRFFAQPDGLGICSLAFSYEGEEDAAWNLAEEGFSKVDEAMAIAAQNELFNYSQ